MRIILALGLLLLLQLASTEYTNPNCDDKQVIVQLFEWSWDAIANECEEILGPKGFCGVQISPPTEHIRSSEWWARYQPVSYILESRSGSLEQFTSMVERCNAVGVNVIADLVINHMAAPGHTSGTAGSSYDGDDQDFPAVPYSYLDFHQPKCGINDYGNEYEVRNCYLIGLNDLDGSKHYVRDMVGAYINDLIDLGVKGFRVDAAKHMWPEDISRIQDRVNDVDGLRPFFVHEVIDLGGEAVKMEEYFDLGKVTEFNAGSWLSCIRDSNFDCLDGYGNGLADGSHALAFIDNHDNQRNSGGVLTHKESYNYKMATGYNLAHSYGFKRVMSSYYFDNFDDGPPSAPAGERCFHEWVCEHRWSSIMNMVKFANVASGHSMHKHQNYGHALGFSRGSVAFFAMGDLDHTGFETTLPDGEYCDIIHDCKQTVTVENGYLHVTAYKPEDAMVAICVGCD